MHRRTELIIAFRDLHRHRGNADPLIRFLEKDEMRFGSGYAKEAVWHLLKRVSLTESHKVRLRAVALRYLHKRMNREFWYMCRFICRIADEAFRSQVERLAASRDPLVRKRSYLLRAYLESSSAGEAAHREFRYELRQRRYAW